jgi:hypothetical protein
LKLFPPAQTLLPTVPLLPTCLYIQIKSRLFPIYLLTYKFKMCYSSPPTPTSIHLPTCPSIFLPSNILSRYLSNPSHFSYAKVQHFGTARWHFLSTLLAFTQVS